MPYVFFAGDTSTPDNGLPVNGTLAAQLQDYIVSFVRYGDPNAGLGSVRYDRNTTTVEVGSAAVSESGSGARTGAVRFPVYGTEGRVLELGFGGFREGVDDLKGRRCEWIQQAMVDGRL